MIRRHPRYAKWWYCEEDGHTGFWPGYPDGVKLVLRVKVKRCR